MSYMHTAFERRSQAFSLVELSIVLVILGLLVGGVLSGQSLIRAAELRSVSADYSRYVTAAQSFRDKYFALPGDITNATSFWGIAAGTLGNDATCYNTPQTTAATCNGDGDGTLQITAEYYLFWKHLGNAGLIEGSYIGTDGINAGYATSNVRGVTAPQSRVDSYSTWIAYYNAVYAGDTLSFASVASNFFRLSASPTTPSLAPEEAWNIDTKIDDGLPATGKMTARKGVSSTDRPCTTMAGIAPPADAGATYNLSWKPKACGIFMQF